MDPQHIQRLQEEQWKALYETDEKIQQMKKFKDDYKALQARLSTLPDKSTHDIMVPFGKVAFMPGHLYHTNEVIVLLGDNWFAERSAKQATEIAGRRIESIEDQIKGLLEQKKLLEPRKQFTSELSSIAQGKGDVIEIKEEYDEEKEKQWKEKHKEQVKKFHQQQRIEQQKRAKQSLKKMQQEESTSHEMTAEDVAFWERLDQLELKEATNNELIHDSEDLEEENLTLSNLVQENKKQQKCVRWKDEKTNEEDEWCTDSDSDDCDNEEWEEASASEGGSDSDEDVDQVESKVIHFKHTPSEQISCTSCGDEIKSPSDVYKLFMNTNLEKPKSILKNGHETPLICNEEYKEEKAFSAVVKEKPVSFSSAVGSQVTERLDPQKMVSTLVAALDNMPSKPKKKVSKFKQRQSRLVKSNNDNEEHSNDGDIMSEENDSAQDDDSYKKPVSKFKQRRQQKFS